MDHVPEQQFESDPSNLATQVNQIIKPFLDDFVVIIYH